MCLYFVVSFLFTIIKYKHYTEVGKYWVKYLICIIIGQVIRNVTYCFDEGIDVKFSSQIFVVVYGLSWWRWPGWICVFNIFHWRYTCVDAASCDRKRKEEREYENRVPSFFCFLLLLLLSFVFIFFFNKYYIVWMITIHFALRPIFVLDLNILFFYRLGTSIFVLADVGFPF